MALPLSHNPAERMVMDHEEQKRSTQLHSNRMSHRINNDPIEITACDSSDPLPPSRDAWSAMGHALSARCMIRIGFMPDA